jgi:hypothetical protein
VRGPVPRGGHRGKNRTTVTSKPLVRCPCACAVCPGGCSPLCVLCVCPGRTCCVLCCSFVPLLALPRRPQPKDSQKASGLCSLSNPPCAPQGKQGHSLQLQRVDRALVPQHRWRRGHWPWCPGLQAQWAWLPLRTSVAPRPSDGYMQENKDRCRLRNSRTMLSPPLHRRLLLQRCPRPPPPPLPRFPLGLRETTKSAAAVATAHHRRPRHHHQA